MVALYEGKAEEGLSLAADLAAAISAVDLTDVLTDDTPFETAKVSFGTMLLYGTLYNLCHCSGALYGAQAIRDQDEDAVGLAAFTPQQPSATAGMCLPWECSCGQGVTSSVSMSTWQSMLLQARL
jgi:hypothetical protein